MDKFPTPKVSTWSPCAGNAEEWSMEASLVLQVCNDSPAGPSPKGAKHSPQTLSCTYPGAGDESWGQTDYPSQAECSLLEQHECREEIFILMLCLRCSSRSSPLSLAAFMPRWQDRGRLGAVPRCPRSGSRHCPAVPQPGQPLPSRAAPAGGSDRCEMWLWPLWNAEAGLAPAALGRAQRGAPAGEGWGWTPSKTPLHIQAPWNRQSSPSWSNISNT